jgi:uncharacterized membrane protein
MLAISLLTLGVTAFSLYIGVNIQDEVFKAAMIFTSVLFALVTLICAPWLLKIGLIAAPFVLGGLNLWSRETL